MNGLASLAILLLVITAVWVAVFLIFRAFVLWYWRVSEIVDLLKDIRDRLPTARTAADSSGRKKAETAIKPIIKCPKCGVRQELDTNSRFCDQCTAPLRDEDGKLIV